MTDALPLSTGPIGLPGHRIAHPGDELTPGRRLGLIIILGALTALGPFTVDLYLPAFPQLQEEFVVSPELVQFTLSGTIIGFALGQILMGPLSDRIGRKVPLLTATTLHVIASIAAFSATDIMALNVARVFQGFGAAAGSVVAMAMVRDLFSGHRLVNMLSRLALVNGLAPVLAPVIGSQLLLWTDWRGTFVFLTIYGAVMLVLSILFIRETLPKQHRRQSGMEELVRGYKKVLSDRAYIGAIVVGAMTFGGLFAYVASSSFLFQDAYGFNSQEFGYIFAVNSVGLIIGVQTSSRLTRWFQPAQILKFATLGQFAGGATMVLGHFLELGVLGLILPLWFFVMCCGFSFPMIQVLALMNHGREAGTAASLLGAVNNIGAGVVTPIMGVLGVSTSLPLGSVIAITGTLGFLAVTLILMRGKILTLDEVDAVDAVDAIDDVIDDVLP